MTFDASAGIGAQVDVDREAADARDMLDLWLGNKVVMSPGQVQKEIEKAAVTAFRSSEWEQLFRAQSKLAVVVRRMVQESAELLRLVVKAV